MRKLMLASPYCRSIPRSRRAKKSSISERGLFRNVRRLIKIFGAVVVFTSGLNSEGVMGLAMGQGCPDTFVNLEQTWPLDARMAVFLLEAEGDVVPQIYPRELDRFPCRVRARLMRVKDKMLQFVEVFVRDLSIGHVGFVSSEPLEVGAIYQLDFTPGSKPVHVSCVVGR